MTASQSIFSCPVLLFFAEPARLASFPFCARSGLPAFPASSCMWLGLNFGRFLSPLSTATSSFRCNPCSCRRSMISTRPSPHASSFMTAGDRSASAMYGAASFFVTAAIRLRALAGFPEPGDFLFQSLNLLLQAIGHVGQLLEQRQQFKLPRRQFVSRDVRQDEFLCGHGLATWRVTTPQKLTSPSTVYKRNLLRPPRRYASTSS